MPLPLGHSPLNPGTRGRREAEVRPGSGCHSGSRARGHIPHSGDVNRSQREGLRLPSVLGVFSPRGGSCLPLQSGKSSQPTALVGKKGREGEERRPPSSSNLTHTPRRHSKLRRQSPQRAAGRALPPAVPVAQRAVGSKTPARTPRPGAGSPKPEPAARCKQEAFAAGQSARGAGARTRNAHPLGPSGMKVGPAETHPRRISRAP